MEKRYYWLKLRFNFFFDNEVFDYIMRQSDGSRYIVLYQMLCMKTLNNAGELASRIGDIIIPFDTDKIRTECKYFSKSEIICALDLFRRFGLVYEQEDGTLRIANFDDMVGSEGASAARVRKYRAAQKELGPGNGQAVGALHCNNDVTQCSVTQPLQERYTAVTSCVTSRKEAPPTPPGENREIDIEVEEGAHVGASYTAATAPSLEECREYAEKNSLMLNVDRFYWWYEERKWFGVVDWQKRMQFWGATEHKEPTEQPSAQPSSGTGGSYIPASAGAEFRRGEIRAELEKDDEYRELSRQHRMCQLALAKEAIEGREPTAEQQAIALEAEAAMIERIRQLGFDPKECL